MKKSFQFLTLMASAVMMFTACTSDKLEAYAGQPDPNPENPDNAVTFGTYMGKSATTRAGYQGPMTTDLLKNGTTTNGFGVFAYYTGTADYTQNKLANFMYNQQVTFTGPNWIYSPIKYWPNEIQNGAVDDQDNDTGSDPATSANANGGKVSFFAYAPYVYVSTSGTNIGKEKVSSAADGYDVVGSGKTQIGTKDVGITNITANSTTGDPKITYVLASDGNNVDLLWGTLAAGTGENVLGAANAGKQYNASGTTYEQAILNGYTVPADLTKQKVEGKINIAFKHALAKIGGSVKKSDETISDKAGLLVQLDIDKDGSETGGTKDANTVVTIESIEIKNCEVGYDSDGDGDIDASDTPAYVTGGTFNLATGKWSNYTTGSETDAVTHTIKRTDADVTADLNTDIAEPESVTEMSNSGGGDYQVNGTVPGVTTDKKHVYKAEASPFVFIPGTKPSFEITVTYIVRTFDPNLASTANDDTGTDDPKSSTWSKVKQTIKKKVSFNDAVQLNKQYSLVMHLGLTSVKFEATVSDWDVDGTDNNGNGTIDEGEVNINDVYLPINVQGETTSTTVAAGSNATVNTAASNATYTLNLTGLTDGSTFAESHTGSGISSVSVTTPVSVTTQAVTVTLNPNRTNQPVVNTVTLTESGSGTSTTTVTITQNPDNTYTLTPTVIGKAASSTGTITVSGGIVSSVTATTTPSGLSASVSSNVVTYTADAANDTGGVKTYDGIVLTINDGTNNYVYTTSITQAKD